MQRLNKIFFFLIPIVLLANSCQKILFVEEPAEDPESVFEYFWNYYNDNYAVFDERHVNWHELYDAYRPLVNENTTDDELYNIITNMLTTLNDGHVMVIAEGHESFSSNKYYQYRIDDSLFNKDVIKSEYLDAGFVEEDGYTYGTINNEIIYLFLPYISDNMPIVNDVLDMYPDAKGIIVDLRHNSGGDFTWALSDLKRLTNERKHVFTSRTKNGPGENDFTDWFDWYIEPGDEFYNKPVILLTDRYTISAGERTTMIFRELPNTIIIGDTTNSSHSTMVTNQLANGWYFTLSTQEVKLPDGNSYEGIGIAPDIYIRNTITNLENGIDDVLSEAILQF